VGKLIYSMSVSADGFIAGPDGDFSWTEPSEELFRFHTDRVRRLRAHLCGRRLYETMLYWEAADQDPRARARRAPGAACQSQRSTCLSCEKRPLRVESGAARHGRCPNNCLGGLSAG
jgi:hypothetical protein